MNLHNLNNYADEVARAMTLKSNRDYEIKVTQDKNFNLKIKWGVQTIEHTGSRKGILSILQTLYVLNTV